MEQPKFNYVDSDKDLLTQIDEYATELERYIEYLKEELKQCQSANQTSLYIEAELNERIHKGY